MIDPERPSNGVLVGGLPCNHAHTLLPYEVPLSHRMPLAFGKGRVFIPCVKLSQSEASRHRSFKQALFALLNATNPQS